MSKQDWQTLVIIPIDNPEPVAFEGVYEPKDRWEKLVGCEGCETAARCCGWREGVEGCPLLVPGRGCLLHLQTRSRSQKPLNCIVNPLPSQAKSHCQQEWLCTRGTHKGKIRCIRKPGNVFDDPPV